MATTSNASGQQKQAAAYFLSIGKPGSDPSDEFIKRFANHIPPVRKASASSSSRQGGR